jgi:hypothetical protein
MAVINAADVVEVALLNKIPAIPTKLANFFETER